MDAYLEIAHNVLRKARRPMTARAILDSAYNSGMVLDHLHGKTQHKTLGARLSEDLVRRGERSPFFRTAPGKFFLREFLTDKSLPESFRRPVPTRRRFRELILGPALALNEEMLPAAVLSKQRLEPISIFKLFRDSNFEYADPRTSTKHIFLRSFVFVCKGNKVLSYRLGRYREDRDAFMNKRCIGFSSYIHDFDHTLFNQGDLGILDAGLKAAKSDLDIPETSDAVADGADDAEISYFLCAHGERFTIMLAVIRFECPSWFEPTKRRLALNDLEWIKDISHLNDIDDFDPWSRSVIETMKWSTLKGGRNLELSYPCKEAN